MGYTKANSHSSSEEGYVSDEEGLLKHESHNGGVHKRIYRTYCRSAYAMPTFHISLILLYTLVFFLSYNSVRSSKPGVNLVYCKHHSRGCRLEQWNYLTDIYDL